MSKPMSAERKKERKIREMLRNDEVLFFYFDRNILMMMVVKDKIDRPIEEFRQHLIHMEMKIIEK